MIQWIGILIAVVGLAYNGFKDYQKGDIKLPTRQKIIYPIQYCLMAYDPNIDKVFYRHENGIWHDYPPQQRRYSSSTQPQQNQSQSQEILGTVQGTYGESGRHYVR
jgi:uncharacterized membrane protein YebE (DUF533 family)